MAEMITREDLLKRYRLDYPRDIPEDAGGNIAAIHNPFWIKRFGEGKFAKNSDEYMMPDDHTKFRLQILGLRKEGEFCGLKNRGRFCYANSTLQSWFHNGVIRTAILSQDVDREQDGIEVARALKTLFVELKFSKFKDVDPTPLYATLGLQRMEECDAEEFKMILLEQLSQIPSLKTMFENNLFGTIQRKTTCTGCGVIRTQDEAFSYIGVQPSDGDLINAIQTSLIPHGVEYIKCGECSSELVGNIQYLRLPPMLQFQVQRYKFEGNEVKKILTPFGYPDEGDFSSLMLGQDQSSQDDYKIFATLMHRGTRANSGHYVMNVMDHQTKTWHEFNDILTEEYEISEDGNNNSCSVYMIMYIKKSLCNNGNAISTVQNQMEARLKVELETEQNKEIEAIRLHHQRRRERGNLVQRIMNCPKTEDIDTFHFFSNTWLKCIFKISDDGKDVPHDDPVDNNVLLCPHNMVKPPPPANLRRIPGTPYRVLPRDVSEQIYAAFGGGPHLTVREHLCEICKPVPESNAKSKKGEADEALDEKDPVEDMDWQPNDAFENSAENIIVTIILPQGTGLTGSLNKKTKAITMCFNHKKTFQEIRTCLDNTGIIENLSDFNFIFNNTMITNADMTLEECKADIKMNEISLVRKS